MVERLKNEINLVKRGRPRAGLNNRETDEIGETAPMGRGTD